ncbi:hypothetical protein EYF80_007114 [Liparis tanakae]|uniref:Uncharacterized protein n=1 Tax=Liparis tanakae TaxID=230148 RepID=A0A4Z2IXI6_9TELE|nr:hypothetical protein EYF80_007114 [Liparis tanakae]
MAGEAISSPLGWPTRVMPRYFTLNTIPSSSVSLVSVQFSGSSDWTQTQRTSGIYKNVVEQGSTKLCPCRETETSLKDTWTPRSGASGDGRLTQRDNRQQTTLCDDSAISTNQVISCHPCSLVMLHLGSSELANQQSGNQLKKEEA